MRFLADESCDFSVVRALRSAGYEVKAVAEISPRAEDTEVLHLAFREKRILLTEDKDFGQLVFAHSKKTRGVIFIRYPIDLRQKMCKEVVNLVKQCGENLIGNFVVVQPSRIRIIRTPEDQNSGR